MIVKEKKVKEKKVFCDICGRPIEREDGMFKFRMFWLGHKIPHHMCWDCYQSFRVWANDRVRGGKA